MLGENINGKITICGVALASLDRRPSSKIGRGKDLHIHP